MTNPSHWQKKQKKAHNCCGIRIGRESHRTGRCNQARLRIRRVEHVRQQVASPFLWHAPVQTLRVLLLEAEINFSKVRN